MGSTNRIQNFGLSPGGVRIFAALALLPLLAACAGTAPATISPSVAVAAPAQRHPQLQAAQIASLDNLTSDAIVARLGSPNFRRVDPPAEIWQYRGVSCVLDLFLYPDGSNMRVAHATTRDRQALGAQADTCTPFADVQPVAAVPNI